MFDWLYILMEKLVENVFGLSLDTGIGDSVHFFFYDSVKIIILLGFMIFTISFVRSFFSPEKTKEYISKFNGISKNVMASFLGIVTPFCSCSSVPLFIGFVEGGIPLGVTFSFLITSPIVNEAAFAILWASFGWKVAVLYVAMGVVLGVVGGIIIDKMKLEKYVEEYVYEMQMNRPEIEELTFRDRINFAKSNTLEIIGRVWKYVLVGIAIGAAIHGWAPEAALTKYAGPGNPFAVLAATVIAVPLYSNALGTIPIAEALLMKGVGLGTAMAFMMATTALSFPEMVLLRKVIKPKLIANFVAITAIGIVFIGYMFNGIAHLVI
jgi:hypothetical protein